MAFSIVFEGAISDATGKEWYYEIVSLDTIVNTEKEGIIAAPGVSLTYESDSLAYSKAMIGSSLNMSMILTDNQLTKLESLIALDEGRAGIFFYNEQPGGFSSTDQYETWQSGLEWMGHLLIESTTIEISNNNHRVDLLFTCGLGSLKYFDWKQNSGSFYSDRKTCAEILFRAFAKLPSFSLLQERIGLIGAPVPDIGTHDYLFEVGLPNAASGTGTANESNYEYGALYRNYVHSHTFVKPKDNTERHRNLIEGPEFINCYDVVEDVCKTFGACITMTRGGWFVWNRSSIINFSDNTDTVGIFVHKLQFLSSFGVLGYTPYSIQTEYLGNTDFNDIFIGSSDTQHTLSGATEGRTLPISGAVMTHEDAESDIVIAEGLARRRFRGFDPTPGFGSHSLFTQNQLAWQLSANDQYSYAHNRDYGYEYIFDFTLYDYEDTNIAPPLRSSLETDNNTFRVGFPDRTNSNIRIEGGQDFMFSVRGDLKLREKRIMDSLTYSNPVGSTYVIAARIEVTHTDNTVYRLSRRVVVDGVANNDIGWEAPSSFFSLFPYYDQFGTHKLKTYGDLEWIADDGDGYDDAWYEIMIPHGDNVDNDAGRENVLTQLPGLHEGQNHYSGIHLDYDEDESNPLQASQSTLEGAYRHLYFKEGINFQFPGDNTDLFDIVKLSWRFSCLSDDGDVIFESGTNSGTSNATFPDTGSAMLYPERLRLGQAQIRLGNGAEDMDLRTRSTGGSGFETLNIGSSRIGSRNGLLNPQVTGHLTSHVYTGTQWDTNTGDDALDGKGFVNVRWLPYKNGSTGGPNESAFPSLHQLLCHEYLKVYGAQRKTFAGQIVSREEGENFIRPYQIFKTEDYDETTAHQIMMTRMSWSMMDGTSFEGISINEDRYAEVVSVEETKPRGPGSGRTPDKPGLGNVPDGLTVGGLSDEIDGIGGDIVTIQSKTDNITGDADGISDITFAPGSDLGGDIDKLQHITITSAVDLNAISSDDVSDAGNTNKFVTGEDVTKLGYITVTSAVDLNDISGVSATDAEKLGHISADADGITSITVKNGSTPISHDEIGYDVDTLLDADGNEKPADALKDNPGDITLIGKSAITGHEGTYKFSADDLYKAILLNGIDLLVDGGYGTEDEFSGSTTSILGDFDNDGEVGTADLLSFLANYGSSIEDATADSFFQLSSVEIVRDSDDSVLTDVPDSDQSFVILSWNPANDIQNNFTGTQTTTITTTDIQFTTGSVAPLSAFPEKRIQIKTTAGFGNGVANELYGVRLLTQLPDQEVIFRTRVRAFDVFGDQVTQQVKDVIIRAEGAPGEYNFSPTLFTDEIRNDDFVDTSITNFKVDFMVRALDTSTTSCQIQLRALRVRLNKGNF